MIPSSRQVTPSGRQRAQVAARATRRFSVRAVLRCGIPYILLPFFACPHQLPPTGFQVIPSGRRGDPSGRQGDAEVFCVGCVGVQNALYFVALFACPQQPPPTGFQVSPSGRQVIPSERRGGPSGRQGDAEVFAEYCIEVQETLYSIALCACPQQLPPNGFQVIPVGAR